MDKKTKFKKFIKKLFSLLVVIIVIFSFVDLFRPNSHTLSINVKPEDAEVTIGGYKSIGDFKTKLDDGSYQIKTEKAGYLSDIRQLDFNKDTNLIISLTPLSENLISSKDVVPIDISPLSKIVTSGKTNSYGINGANGNLVMMSDNKLTPIFNGITKDFDIKGNIAVIIDDSDLSKIIIKNLDTLSQRTINLSQYSPIISTTISDDLTTIYFLAQFTINNKTPSLYSIPTAGGDAVKLTETRALEVKYVKNGILSLFEKTHAQDKNVFHAFSVNESSDVFKKNTNTYSISPNKNNVYLQTTTDITIWNTNDFNSKSLYTGNSSRAIWKDDNTILVFQNSNNNTNMAVLTLEPFIINPFSVLVEGSTLQNVIGISQGKLYLQSYDNKVFALEI